VQQKKEQDRRAAETKAKLLSLIYTPLLAAILRCRYFRFTENLVEEFVYSLKIS